MYLARSLLGLRKEAVGEPKITMGAALSLTSRACRSSPAGPSRPPRSLVHRAGERQGAGSGAWIQGTF